MYERRHYVRGDALEHKEDHEDKVLAKGYSELSSLYKLYQEAALTMDRRYVPQVWIRTRDNGNGQLEEYKEYYNPAVDRLFDEREKALSAREAIPAGSAVERDESEMKLAELRATLEHQKNTFKEDIKVQWLAFERLCAKIADNVYVKQFYHRPLFQYLSEGISQTPNLGTVFFPTQESRLTQYRVDDGIVYYNGKQYRFENGDWNAKREQILTKLLSFENPFP